MLIAVSITCTLLKTRKSNMITSLYPIFQKWSETGSIYLVSDTHFDDTDCKLMYHRWITASLHMQSIANKVHKGDTLIHLGDVGSKYYFKNAWKPGKKPHLVLITGNHDRNAAYYSDVFDEVYTGPLFISDKILLSHEPIQGCNWCLNIHGHCHMGKQYPDAHHVNLASNVVNFKVVNLNDIIKSGALKRQKGIHRVAIDASKQNPVHRPKKKQI